MNATYQPYVLRSNSYFAQSAQIVREGEVISRQWRVQAFLNDDVPYRDPR